MESFAESIDRDLAKCRSKQGHRPIWVIAEDNNKRDKVVKIKKVASLPVFMGC